MMSMEDLGDLGMPIDAPRARSSVVPKPDALSEGAINTAVSQNNQAPFNKSRSEQSKGEDLEKLAHQ